MAGGVTFDSGDEILRSPRQASSIFGLGGARPPRQKNLFVVNFRKNGDATTTTGSTSGGSSLGTGTWNKDLGFLVKSVDRPSVEPKTEELNQYNKKRIIHTGYKIGTTRLTLYDTADSMAMRMWAEYSKYYFGDFRHQSGTSGTSNTDFQFDTVLPEFKDTNKAGFGFAPQSSTTTAATTTSDYTVPYFFDTISVYQVFGKKYVRFDLVNPKITSFDPDELDYSNSEVASFSMQIACEAVLYQNDFQPQDISSDSFLKEAFGDIAWLNGDVHEYPGNDSTAAISYPSSTIAASVAQPYYQNPVVSQPVVLQDYSSSFSTGSLNAYGRYNFGSTNGGSTVSRSLATDIALAAVTNPALASVLGLADRTTYADASTRNLIQPYTAPTYISQATYDEASAAVASLTGLPANNPNLLSALTYGAISSALATGTTSRDQVYNRQPPANTAPPNSWSSATSTGMALTNEAYGIMNAQRPASSQIGFNTQSTAQYAPPARPAPVGVGGGNNADLKELKDALANPGRFVKPSPFIGPLG